MRALVLALLAASLLIGSVVPVSKGKTIHRGFTASCAGSGLDPDGRCGG
jgi:hypothetical protein